MAAPRRTLMRWTVSSSLRFRYLVIAVAVLVMGLGILSLPSNRVDAFPEFAPPRVVVQTACLGLSTSDVEQLVSVPLEQAFNGIDGLDTLRSKSVPQLSMIELIFKQGVNEFHARQLVAERMRLVASTLPTWAAPPVMLAVGTLEKSPLKKAAGISVESEVDCWVFLSPSYEPMKNVLSRPL